MTGASARAPTAISVSEDRSAPRPLGLPSDEAALALLRSGRVRVLGLMPDCSNYTYLTDIHDRAASIRAIYKPAEGESPLEDFPEGSLGKREVAAYLVSEALGWRLVPPTVYRTDLPLGPGSLQLFISADLTQHYFTLMPARAATFRTMAVFDWLVNNADRKSGHCLLDADGHIWGIDNGLTFHTLPKLRTVIWEFAGEPIAHRLRHDAGGLAGRLLGAEPWVSRLASFLAAAELRALSQRARQIAEHGEFPRPVSRWAYPWPLI